MVSSAVYVCVCVSVCSDPFMRKSLSRTKDPIESYKLLKQFLLVWKRLEHFKAEWGKNKLGVEAIDTPAVYANFW